MRGNDFCGTNDDEQYNQENACLSLSPPELAKDNAFGHVFDRTWSFCFLCGLHRGWEFVKLYVTLVGEV